MKLLFVHQNMPGQYRELLRWLVAQGEHEIAFLTQRQNAPMHDQVRTIVYKPHHIPKSNAYGLSKVWEEATGAGFGAVQAAVKLERDHNFKPDIVIGHVGWGELTFFKQVWPDVPIIGFFEYYYNMTGGLVGFDPEDPPGEHAPFLMQARNAVPLANIATVDLGQCPTYWQRDRFPDYFHEKMYVCHDGIRTDNLRPNPNAAVQLGRLDAPITPADEVITYVARNLERTRGYHIFMRALPKILEGRPKARVIVLGGNDVSYGKQADHPGGLRGQMEAEVGDQIDWSRVHFLGKVPYPQFCQLVQISRCHIYLTMPFVLSWSLMEAMSMQARIVAANVAPVREMICHGETGMLVEFFDHDALAQQVIEVSGNPEAYAGLGVSARQHMVESYDFLTKCLPVHLDKINALVPSGKRITIAGAGEGLRGPR